MYIGLVDKYGTIVGTSNNEQLKIEIVPIGNSTEIISYPPIATNIQNIFSKDGVYVLSDIKFTAAPGQLYKFRIVSDGIDSNKPSNKQYLQDLKSEQIEFQYNISLRQCSVGEQFTESGSQESFTDNYRCELCDGGTQYSLTQMISPGVCKECPTSQAICLGGSKLGPQPGYWRKNAQTQVFIRCLNQISCLQANKIKRCSGFIPPEYNEKGSCDTGYQGILCSDCSPGYSISGPFTCDLCPDFTQNGIRIAAILIAAVILVVLMIRSTLNGALEKRNVTSIFQKILLNHFQLIILTASFNFNWPAMVKEFFKTSQPVGEASTQIFSVDCFLNQESEKIEGTINERQSTFPIRIFYFKLIMFSALPFFLTAISYLVWGIMQLRKHDNSIVKTKAISTIVILLFFIHPNLVNFVFNFFNCIDVDGESRVKNDLEIICYQGDHFFWAMILALPSLLVWGLGIPLFAYALMFRQRHKLDTILTRQMFGYLFRGYKQRYYYWEIVIMYRKIFLIFIQVFLVQFGIITQALVVFLLLIISLIINLTKKPFQTVTLNQLETLSLATSMLTIFCGLFFIVEIEQKSIDNSETPSTQSGVILDNNTKIFFFAIIIVSNLVFFIYWIIKMLEEVHLILVKKMAKIYTALCLCGNSKRYQDILKEAIIQEENEILREGYMDTIKVLKDLYNSGNLTLNKNTLERLQIYLNGKKVLAAAGIDINRKLKEEEVSMKKRNTRIMKRNIQKKHVFEDIADFEQSKKHLMLPADSDRIIDQLESFHEEKKGGEALSKFKSQRKIKFKDSNSKFMNSLKQDSKRIRNRNSDNSLAQNNFNNNLKAGSMIVPSINFYNINEDAKEDFEYQETDSVSSISRNQRGNSSKIILENVDEDLSDKSQNKNELSLLEESQLENIQDAISELQKNMQRKKKLHSNGENEILILKGKRTKEATKKQSRKNLKSNILQENQSSYRKLRSTTQLETVKNIKEIKDLSLIEESKDIIQQSDVSMQNQDQHLEDQKDEPIQDDIGQAIENAQEEWNLDEDRERISFQK